MDSLNAITHTASLPLWIDWVTAIAGILYILTIFYLLLKDKIYKFWKSIRKKKLHIEVNNKEYLLKCSSLYITAEITLDVFEAITGEIKEYEKRGYRLIIFARFNITKDLQIESATDVNFIPTQGHKIEMAILNLTKINNAIDIMMISKKWVKKLPDGINISIKYKEEKDFRSLIKKELLNLENSDWGEIYREKIKDAIDREAIL